MFHSITILEITLSPRYKNCTAFLTHYSLAPYFLENGAGTSIKNLVTPVTMTQLLNNAYQNKALTALLIPALPIAGVDGTLKEFPSPLLTGKVHAKTGSLSGVSTLAGFIYTKTGKTLIFSILIDNAVIPESKRQELEAKILENIYNLNI